MSLLLPCRLNPTWAWGGGGVEQHCCRLSLVPRLFWAVLHSPLAGACLRRLAQRGRLACIAVNEIPKEIDTEQVTDCCELQRLHDS